jgi:hypothetical protein
MCKQQSKENNLEDQKEELTLVLFDISPPSYRLLILLHLLFPTTASQDVSRRQTRREALGLLPRRRLQLLPQHDRDPRAQVSRRRIGRDRGRGEEDVGQGDVRRRRGRRARGGVERSGRRFERERFGRVRGGKRFVLCEPGDFLVDCLGTIG